jgi:hypothetical protein
MSFCVSNFEDVLLLYFLNSIDVAPAVLAPKRTPRGLVVANPGEI